MKKSSWKFIGIESLFLLVMVLAISLCSYIQYLGMIDTGRGCGGIFGGSIYQFNPIAYVLGLGLYVVAFILCNKYILSKCMELMPDTKIWAKIFYFVLMGVFGFLGFMGVMYVYLMVFGLAGTVEDTVLELITWFGWPAALLIVMVVRFIINCVKTQPELVMEAVDKPLVDDSIVELDEIMEGIDYIKKPEAETEEETETKAEEEAKEETDAKAEEETKEEAEVKAEEETKEETEVKEEADTKKDSEDSKEEDTKEADKE